MSRNAGGPATPPAYTLRPATEADYAALYELHVASMGEYVERTWGWDDALQARWFRERFDRARPQIIVVEGQTAGSVTVHRRPDEIYLDNIEITPRFQNRGLGTAILRNLMREASDRGVPLRLRVLKVNPARRLYERLAFTITGEIEHHYYMALTPAATRPADE